MLELILRAQLDALYLDPSVLVVSPNYVPSLVERTKQADLAIAADKQLGFTNPVQNDYDCLGVSAAYDQQYKLLY